VGVGGAGFYCRRGPPAHSFGGNLALGGIFFVFAWIVMFPLGWWWAGLAAAGSFGGAGGFFFKLLGGGGKNQKKKAGGGPTKCFFPDWGQNSRMGPPGHPCIIRAGGQGSFQKFLRLCGRDF